ncbi:MAG TPA: DUF3037 domain-containing protein [Longimicrobiaceae bacterium]|nr:DUF3037 domain-containing protein [Longimicrobiaceae bacterium]
MSSESLITYHFAILRLVPHVHRGEFVNVGVVLHARTAEFLAIRAITDPKVLADLAPKVDTDLLLSYLDGYRGICAGDASAGPIALAPPSERFHWLSAPRSDLLQSSPVHEGLCIDPEHTIEELFEEFVAS